jgi:hypothetical protein
MYQAEAALRFASAEGDMAQELMSSDGGESRADKDTRRLSKAERMKKVMKHKETGEQ